ncbi:hypothetical protein K488DRAFT_43178, partial [Vararia minispora EC-137]
LLAALFNWTLYGVLCVQVYVYARSFPKDRLWMKLLVLGTFLFETAQTAMNGADIYYWFAEGFGNIPRLAEPHLSPIDVPMFVAIISLVVQLFFAYRIYSIMPAFLPAVILIVVVSVMLLGSQIDT